MNYFFVLMLIFTHYCFANDAFENKVELLSLKKINTIEIYSFKIKNLVYEVTDDSQFLAVYLIQYYATQKLKSNILEKKISTQKIADFVISDNLELITIFKKRIKSYCMTSSSTCPASVKNWSESNANNKLTYLDISSPEWAAWFKNKSSRLKLKIKSSPTKIEKMLPLLDNTIHNEFGTAMNSYDLNWPTEYRLKSPYELKIIQLSLFD